MQRECYEMENRDVSYWWRHHTLKGPFQKKKKKWLVMFQHTTLKKQNKQTMQWHHHADKKKRSHKLVQAYMAKEKNIASVQKTNTITWNIAQLMTFSWNYFLWSWKGPFFFFYFFYLWILFIEWKWVKTFIETKQARRTSLHPGPSRFLCPCPGHRLVCEAKGSLGWCCDAPRLRWLLASSCWSWLDTRRTSRYRGPISRFP